MIRQKEKMKGARTASKHFDDFASHTGEIVLLVEYLFFRAFLILLFAAVFAHHSKIYLLLFVEEFAECLFLIFSSLFFFFFYFHTLFQP